MLDVDRQKKRGPRRLKIGSRLFYPGHGVVSVLGLEERAFGAAPQCFYVFGMSRSEKLLLPVGNLDKAGVRALVSAAKARKLLRQVATAPTSATGRSSQDRTADYTDGLRSGCPDRYTETLRELLFRARAKNLSSSDRRALEVARGYFVSEISAALARPASEIEAALEGDGAEGHKHAI